MEDDVWYKETAEKHALVDIIQSGDDTYLKFALKAIGKALSIDEMEFGLCKDIINVSKLSNAFIDVEKKVVIGDSKNSARIFNSTILASEIIFNSGCIEIEAKNPGGCLLFSKKDVINQRGEALRFEIRSEQDDLVKIDFPNIDSYFKLRKYLYFYMGKIGIMAFPFVHQRRFDFAFALIPKLRCRNPFPMEKKLTFGGETDDVILFQIIKL